MFLKANKEERLVTGLMLPYGEIGFTNLGKVTASKGAVSLPEDITSVTLNMEHTDTRPVGRATSIEETDEGLVATFKIAKTTTGDDLLEEISDGLRSGLSVEVDSPIIKAGQMLSGLLTACAAVVNPAFNSARVLTAADCGDFEDSAPVEQTPKEETDMGDVTAPVDLVASATAGAPKEEEACLSLSAVNRMIASAVRSGDDRKLTAAIENIAVSTFDDAVQPQYLGEIWSGRGFTQRFAPLVNHQALTSRKAVGWRWTETPTVGDYAGFPNEVPSSGAEIEAVEVNSQRLAGGWKLDRELVDFGETAMVDAFFRKAAEDYARKIDGKILTAISNNAVAVTGGTVPSGADAGLVKIVDGALALYNDQNVVPTFAIVKPSVYRTTLLGKSLDALEHLAVSLGMEEGTAAGLKLIPGPSNMSADVIVGASDALTLFELPGASPVRVSGVDVFHGGTDEALYGYYAILFSGLGLVKVV